MDTCGASAGACGAAGAARNVHYEPDAAPAALAAVVDSYDAFRFFKYSDESLAAAFTLLVAFLLWRLARACRPAKSGPLFKKKAG